MTQLRDNVTGMPLWIGYLPDYREAYPLVSEQQRGLGALCAAAETAEEAIFIMRHWAASLPTGGNEVLRPTDEWVRSR